MEISENIKCFLNALSEFGLKKRSLKHEGDQIILIVEGECCGTRLELRLYLSEDGRKLLNYLALSDMVISPEKYVDWFSKIISKVKECFRERSVE